MPPRCVCTSRPELQQLSPLDDSRCSYLNNIPNSLASLTRDSPAPHHRDPGVPGILFQERTNPSRLLVDSLPLALFNDPTLSQANDFYTSDYRICGLQTIDQENSRNFSKLTRESEEAKELAYFAKLGKTFLASLKLWKKSQSPTLYAGRDVDDRSKDRPRRKNPRCTRQRVARILKQTDGRTARDKRDNVIWEGGREGGRVPWGLNTSLVSRVVVSRLERAVAQAS